MFIAFTIANYYHQKFHMARTFPIEVIKMLFQKTLRLLDSVACADIVSCLVSAATLRIDAYCMPGH
jgi:hypothetical protein